MRADILSAENGVFTVSGFFSSDECRASIDDAERRGFEDAPITTKTGFVMAPDVRNNTRVIVDDVARAEACWERLRALVPARRGPWSAFGLNERFRLYRYDVGQQFAWHRDGAFERERDQRSRLTVLVYLNDDFDGGATELALGERLVVEPRAGMALLFAHSVKHRGAPVIRGRKYVLRTDVMYRFTGSPA